MKVAILSESPADEAALAILVEGILGEPIEVHRPSLRSRGFPAAVNVVPAVLKNLHYQRSADALVVVVDSDNSPIHRAEHDAPNLSSEDCRFCQIRSRLGQVRAGLTRIIGYPDIEVAVAVAPPSIEAWYLWERPTVYGSRMDSAQE